MAETLVQPHSGASDNEPSDSAKPPSMGIRAASVLSEKVTEIATSNPNFGAPNAEGDAAAGPPCGRNITGAQQVIKAVEENEGIFAARSALGQQFSRALLKDTLLKKQHEEATDKQSVKTWWVNREYQKAKALVQKHYSTSRVDQHSKNGKLVSFLKMLYLEGGPQGQHDPETIQNCKVMAQKCIDLGYPYVQVDPMHKGVKYLYFELQVRETFQKVWKEKMVNDPDAAPQPRPSTIPSPKPKPKPDKANANKDITGKSGKPTNNKKDANFAGVNKSLQEAKKEMTALQGCISSASSLLSTIKAGGEWTWARSEAIQGETTKMLENLESRVGAIPLYGLLRLQVEPKDIKKKLSAADLQMQSTKIKNLHLDGQALTEKVQAAMRANEGLKAASSKSMHEGVQPTRGTKRKT